MPTNQEHAIVQTVWRRLAYKLICDLEIALRPVVLASKLVKSLGSAQGRLDTLHSSGKVVLRLVEDLIVLQNFENSVPLLKLGLGVKELGDGLDIDIGAIALLLEKLAALRARGLEVLDP